MTLHVPRRAGGLALFLWLSACACFAQAVENIEAPAALVLSGKPRKMPSVAGRWQEPLERGVALFPGDQLLGEPSAETRIAVCRSSGDGAVWKLAPASSATVDAGTISAQPPAILERRVSRCRLPRIHRIPRPGTEYDTEAGPPPTPRGADAVASTQPVLPPQSSDGLDLLAMASEAGALESNGDRNGALQELREIRRLFPEATWTRDVISRLVLENIQQAKAIVPDLTARKVVDPTQVEVPGTDPDFSTGETYALVIGLSEYPAGKRVTKLRFADTDALTFARFLESKRGGAVPKKNIQLLTNAGASRDAIDRALIEFVQGKGGKNNTLIVFIAAHGNYVCVDKEPDAPIDQPCEESKKEPMIIVRDGDTEASSVTGYPMRRMREIVTLRALDFGRVLVYLDVCHSGNVNWHAGDEALAPTNILTELKARDGRLGIMTASPVQPKSKRQLEYAYESAKLGHGVFTYYLLKGLNGDAQAVGGKVLFESLYAQVTSSVIGFTGALKQIPEHYGSDPGLVVIDNDAKPEIDLTLSAEIAEDELNKRAAGLDPEQDEFERLLARDPRMAVPVLDRIRNRNGAASGAYAELMNEYRVALEDRGQEIILRYLEGDQARMVAEDFRLCADYFTRALEVAPDAAFDEARLTFCRGREAIFAGRNEDAETLLLRTIRMDPARPYAYNALGISYLERALFSNAIAAFREAIRLAPYWAYPRHNLALALAERGQYLDAIAQYRNAATVAPKYSYLPYNLGLLYQQLNRMDDARTAYLEAEKIAGSRCEDRFGPKFTQACQERALPRTALGALATATNKRKLAEQLFKDARQDDPSDLLTAHNYAVLLAGWKDHEKAAEDIWKAILDRNPSHGPSLIGYSALLKRKQRYEEAIPLYRKLTMEMKEYLPARVDLAVALARSNKTEEAAGILNGLMQSRPQNPNLWAAQAEVLTNQGKTKEASNAWDNALLYAAPAEQREFRARRKQLAQLKSNLQH